MDLLTKSTSDFLLNEIALRMYNNIIAIDTIAATKQSKLTDMAARDVTAQLVIVNHLIRYTGLKPLVMAIIAKNAPSDMMMVNKVLATCDLLIDKDLNSESGDNPNCDVAAQLFSKLTSKD